nr:integrase, catalytic region, zinc finger, CCHC-type, peptidase aspartic, catalytic [Tanacetum cinerariifolium]
MCKKSITKSTYFGYLDPFIKNTIEQNFSPEIERILNGLNQFQRCLKEEMVADLRYFNSLEFEVDSLRPQLETQKTQFSNKIDRLSREYYYADHMNAILLETQKTQFVNEIDRLSREYYYADHMDAILDLVQGAVTIKRVYYVEGLNHNLFTVGQFCDTDLEVAFRKSTCFIRDLKGNDLLTGSRGSDLYSISLQNTSSPNSLCLMAKATSSQAWLWHRRLSHLNFDTINLLSKNDIVACPERTSSSYTLVEAARTMLSAAKLPLFFWAEAIATACFTQNRSLVIPRHEETPYHIINDRKPSVKFFHIFGSVCYIVRDGENPSEHRWTKDHPLEQVIGNPSQSVRTRRQLESDAEMCIFALTTCGN